MNDTISEAFSKARALADATNDEDDLSQLPESVKTFVLVYSAQGVIDNGGYYRFFDSDWPNRPPYSQFIDAYAKIGCKSQSKDFERVVTSFPFTDPHIKSEKRQKYMNDHYDEENFEVRGWGDILCGDEDVWEKLAVYYHQNKSDFA
jgi:hypothetical protein